MPNDDDTKLPVPVSIDTLVRNYLSEELALLIDEVEGEIDGSAGATQKGKKNSRSPVNFLIVSTETGTRLWFDIRLTYPRTSKKALAFGGILLSGLGLVYQYLFAHSDVAVKVLQSLLDRS